MQRLLPVGRNSKRNRFSVFNILIQEIAEVIVLLYFRISSLSWKMEIGKSLFIK